MTHDPDLQRSLLQRRRLCQGDAVLLLWQQHKAVLSGHHEVLRGSSKRIVADDTNVKVLS
ncbi:MAG: hypothetical protein HKM23_00595 [Nitrosopumilus sp.]|nr:hypothetical protein [Nitrosopumilus sp.]